MAMLRWFGRRSRIDRMRLSLDPAAAAPRSATLTEAVDRLEWALQRHLEQERAVRATEDRLIRALDVIPQGVVLADRDGKVVFHNEPASDFFAARHAEALVEAAISELIADAVDGASATRTLDLYGPPRRVLFLRAVPLYAPAHDGATGEDIEGAFLVVEDISERHRLDAVRRDFVANISHELKTPVGALGLLAETLTIEDDPDVVSRLAQRMQDEAFRVARTIDDLLELSRIEAAQPSIHETVPVMAVLAEAADRMRPAAELSGVPIEVEETSSQVTVVGDRRQLVSAVVNLLDNAVKFSDTGEPVEVRAHTDGSSVEIEVADHGIGIPASDVDRVFERFYRVDRARSRDTGGTGLGLAIVRHVMQNHDGEAEVQTTEGDGSTFVLRLPAGPGTVATDRSPTDLSPAEERAG